MRTVFFGGANTLDNFIAGPGDDIGWIRHGKEAMELLGKLWASLDTIVMGRKTYEATRRLVQGSEGPPEGAFAGISSYVLSRTLRTVPPGTTLVRENGVDFVRRLKAERGKDIFIMGGGELARSLFEARLIDRLHMNIHPLLLGSGVPLFHPMPRRIDLELEDCRPFENGCIYASYRVLPSA
jgi:dihydrofolate reductase